MTTISNTNSGTTGAAGTGGISYGFQMTRTEMFKSVLQGSHTKAQKLAEEAHANRTFGKVDTNIVEKSRENAQSFRQLTGDKTQIQGTSFGKTGATTAFSQFGPAAMGIRA